MASAMAEKIESGRNRQIEENKRAASEANRNEMKKCEENRKNLAA